MRGRVDLAIAVVVWVLGLACLAWTGSWAPLAAGVVAIAVRLVLTDATTRELLTPRISSVVLGVAGGAAMIAVTYALFPACARAFPAVGGGTHALYVALDARAHPPWLLAFVLLGVSASEEIVWRGRLLQPEPRPGVAPPFSRHVPRALAVAALYAAVHAAAGSVVLPVVAFACGCGWSLLRVACGSLWAPVIAHGLWDVAVLVAWPLV